MIRKCLYILILCFSLSAYSQKPIRVLLVLGGHGFDKENFDKMIDSMDGFVFEKIFLPENYTKFAPEQWDSFDIILQYDMNKNMPQTVQKEYIRMLKKGKGMVVLHHSYCGNQDFPEYKKIIGGQYYDNEWMDESGKMQKRSTYEHDVKLSVRVLDPKHPVTKGLANFEIIDELYKGGYIASTVKPLLATNDANCPYIAWENSYGRSKVVTLLLGHDKQAWENSNFTTLLKQALLWVSTER